MNCLSIIPEVLVALWVSLNADLPHQEQVNLCAQVRAESSWRPDVFSRFAGGLAQFTPPTQSDYWPLVGCEGEPVTDPECSLRAQRLYMGRLRASHSVGGQTAEPWHFAWHGYNAGPGWANKERRLCAKTPGCDPTLWEGNVGTVCVRRPSACEETRTYVERILGFGAREPG